MLISIAGRVSIPQYDSDPSQLGPNDVWVLKSGSQYFLSYRTLQNTTERVELLP